VKLIARHNGDELPVEVERHGGGYVVTMNGKTVNVDLITAGPFLYSLRLDDGTQFSLTHHRDGNTHELSLAGSKVVVDIIDPLTLRRRSREDASGAGGVVKALMPGRIVRLLVNQGDVVRKGTGLLILEAMKMENEIVAPADGTVDEIFTTAGQTVEAGADLLHITPA
jgi:biotin carboxyl carrier protein